MYLIKESVKQMQEKIAPLSKITEIQRVANFFYYDFEIVAILSAYNEGKKFLKNAANEILKIGFDILQESLILSLINISFQEIYSVILSGKETCDTSMDKS